MVRNNTISILSCSDDRFIVEHYESMDPAVVVYFRNVPPDDLGVELDRVLALGTRVMQTASPMVTLEVIQREFGETTAQQRAVIEAAKQELREEIAGVLTPVFGDGGTLPSIMKDSREAFERELRKYLDDDSAKSVAASVSKRLDEALTASEHRVQRALRDALDLADESRGLGLIAKAIRGEREALLEKIGEVLKAVEAGSAKREERGLSTRKGIDFERDVAGEVSRIAGIHGDACVPAGASTGDANRKRGDIVIKVDPSLTANVEVAMAIEAMDRDTMTVQKVLAELAEAKKNRTASAAIAVLSSGDSRAACGQLVQRHGVGTYICVLDKESWWTAPLELAYWAARLDALKGVRAAGGGDGIDFDRASKLVEEAMRHLSLVKKLRTKLDVSRDGLTEAETIALDLEARIKATLTELSLMLGRSTE
jgi:hypothetical protein